MTEPSLLAGRYAPGRVLGRGGMGVVFAATDERLGREVALKVLRVAEAPPEALDRFRREARFLASLSHPNVVTVFDFGVDDEQAWLVMERLPGPTLADVVARDGRLPVGAVTSYGAQVAHALEAAHAAGVVHRDVKPANVMLDGHGHCKVLDLGVARLADAQTAATTTGAAALVGSIPFLAPEVVKGEPVTPAVDAYALGAVLFTLLTGHPPYQADVAVATLAQHVNAAVPHPSDDRPDTPAALDELVVALLAKDAGTRPSADEAARRLSAVSAVAPGAGAAGNVGASPAETRVLPVAAVDGSRARRWLRRPAALDRRRLLTAAGVVTVLLVAAAVALAVHGTGGATPQRRTAGVTPPGSPQPSPTQSDTPQPRSADTVAGRFAAVRSAIAEAAATGELTPHDAQELSHRVDDLAHHVVEGKTDDFGHKVDDVVRHLADMGRDGRISAGAYTSIVSALQQLLAVVPGAAPFGDGGGDGG